MDDGQIFIEAREVTYAGMSTGAMHLYLVYRDTDGQEYVLRCGPEYPALPLIGDMKIETNVLIQNSADKRGAETPQDRYSTLLDFGSLSTDEAWAIMVKYSRKIDAANTDYELFEENSNAYIAALLEAAGLDAERPETWLPAGIEPHETVGLSYYDDLMAKVAPPADGVVRGTLGADQIKGIQIDEVIQALAGNDTVWAGRGEDRVFGGSGDDILYGQAGGDTIEGGAGLDKMYAGAGDRASDLFVFKAPSDSAVGKMRDVVYEFLADGSGAADGTGDRIDVSAMTPKTEDGKFVFSTKAAANAIWSVSAGSPTELIVRGDVNGDAKADFEIGLSGVSFAATSPGVLTAEEFIL